MSKDNFDNIIDAIEEPFFYKDTLSTRCLTFLCKLIIFIRFLYLKIPVWAKYVIGLPLFLFNWLVYLYYVLFVAWSRVLEKRFHYDFSKNDFSMKNYFKVMFLRLLLFIILALMMDAYYKYPLGWLGFIYSVPMAFLCVGFCVPIFDYRLRNIE